MFAQWLNPIAQGWMRWLVVSTVDATVVLAVVAALWLLCRRKASARFGCLLFWLVFVKLLLPVEITVPRHWAVCSPGYCAAGWLGVSRQSHKVTESGQQRPTAGDDLIAEQNDKAAEPGRLPVEQEGSTPATPPAFSGVGPSPLEGPYPPNQQASTTAPPSIEAAATILAAEQRGPGISPTAWAMLAWASAVIALIIGFVVMQWRLSRELRGARPLDPRRLPLSLQSLRARIGLRRDVRIVESDRKASPAVWGVFRPLVVLPAGLCDSLTPKQLEWVLLHELAHVRRGDVIAACFQKLITIVYWFHPAVWIAGRMLGRLREYACDDVALTAGSASRRQSGEAFLHVAERASAVCNPLARSLGLCNNKNTLRRRFMRLLDTRRPLKTRLGLGACAALLVLSLVLLPSFRANEASAVDAAAESPLASRDGTADSKPADDQEPAKSASRPLLLTVLDNEGNPISGAKVTVRIRQVTRGPWKVTRHECDESGRVQVDTPKETPRYYAIRVELPGFAPFWADWEMRTGPDPIPESYTVRLDSGRLIGGIVQNEDGEPIQGVEVSPRFNLKMRQERTSPLGASTDITTDARGRWSYPSLPTDVRQLSISLKHAEYGVARVSEPTSKFAMASGEAPTAVLVMKRGLPITGKVTDEEGRPVARAVVRYHDFHNYGSSIPKTETAADGSYRFINARQGETFLTASAEGWAPSLRSVQVEADMDPVDFKLTRGQPLTVRIDDPDEKPLSGVGVSLWTWGGNELHGAPPAGRGETDADGVWTWPHAPQGTLKFHVYKTGYAYIRDQELAAGARENLVTMFPEETLLLRVSGRVIDAQTKGPIARFRVTPGTWREATGINYWRQESQSEGRHGAYRRNFSSSSFSPTTTSILHVIRIEAPGYLPATSRPIKIDEGDVTLDFELEKAPASGAVVLTPQGQAANKATVAVCTPQRGPWIKDGVVPSSSSCERTSTDPQGRFNLAPREGIFALVALHESGLAYVTQEEFARSKTIRLEPWARAEGTLRIGGQPAADERVSLNNSRPYRPDTPRLSSNCEATTDANGHFVFENVMPGEGQVSRVVINRQGRATQHLPTHTTRATFVAGETTQVDLSRQGRPVVGKLVLPANSEIVPHWNYASVTLRVVPEPPPKIPWPAGIDPEKDRLAAIAWLETWRDTEQGRLHQGEVELHNMIARDRQFVMEYAKVEPDGSFHFDDMPGADYQLTVRLAAPPLDGKIGPGKVIATGEHTFTVPEMPGGRSDKPLDLGGLTLSPPGA